MPSNITGSGQSADLKIHAHAVRQRIAAMTPEERRKRMARYVYTTEDGGKRERYVVANLDPQSRHTLAMSTGRRSRVRSRKGR